MKKTAILILCFLLTGCSSRVENPGPPQITVLEDAVIEVNQPDFSPEQLFSYIKAVDASGNPIPQENLSFLNNVSNSLLGTSYIRIKATDSNGYYDIETLKVTTVDKTAPEILLPVINPVLFINESSDWDEKAAGLILSDNFNREDSLLSRSVMIMDSVDTSTPVQTTVAVTVKDSSGNSAKAEFPVMITDQPTVKAQYMMDIVCELTQGSTNYFTFEQSMEMPLISNYDTILDHFFTTQGKQLMEASILSQATERKESGVIWKGYPDQALIRSEPVSIEMIEADESKMSFEVSMQWIRDEETLTQKHPLTLIRENELWKIDDFYNPANGPQVLEED